jgi:hypothetical protein
MFSTKHKMKSRTRICFWFNYGQECSFPTLFHDKISTSNIFINKPQHNNIRSFFQKNKIIYVPLHKPDLGSMFRNNIKFLHSSAEKIKPYEFFIFYFSTLTFLTEKCMILFYQCINVIFFRRKSNIFVIRHQIVEQQHI